MRAEGGRHPGAGQGAGLAPGGLRDRRALGWFQPCAICS